MNVYANDTEAELGEANPYVNTKTMKAARYLCNVAITLAMQTVDIVKQKDENLHHKAAALSAHCAKGNFHHVLTDSGLADAVNLDHHPIFHIPPRQISHYTSNMAASQLKWADANGGRNRKFNLWEFQALATHAYSRLNHNHSK